MEKAEAVGTAGLRQAMGLRDVVLFFITAGVNLQWVATAAVAGPAAITIWMIGCLTMSLPLALCVIELSSRYPQEGGIYVWSKHAFGDFAAFMTGWTYWMSNLPYFPGVLYFAAGNALFLGGGRFSHLSTSRTYFVVASCLGLALGTGMNLIGLGVGKWLTNVGAVARWLAAATLIGVGSVAWWRFGSATSFDHASLTPGLQIRDLIFWSTIAFALTGHEAASFMGEEIRDSRRTIPRGILIAAPLIALVYILGTMSVLVALPAADIGSLQGIMDAFASAGRRLHCEALIPIAAALITISALGSVGCWLGSVARLPFVAGLDNFLPKGFARLHPRWGTPYVALLTQTGVTIICVVLGQAGTSVGGAYNILVGMSVIVFMLPYLFLFASMIRLQWTPAGPGVIRVPGGRAAAIALGAIGLCTTTVAIVLSIFPAPDEAHKGLAVAKVIGLAVVVIASGVTAYALGRRRQRRTGRGQGASHCNTERPG